MRSSEKRLLRTPRTELSQPELHRLLCQAFDRIRPLQCRTCALPTPVPAPAVDEDVPNWMIPATTRCAHNCAGFMRWLWMQYGRVYRLGSD